jgi:ribosomal protein S18 acetylase RimI-like enzyme
MALTLRPIGPADESFLYQLYSSLRQDELAAWGWDAGQQDAFLSLQFRAQQQFYGTIATAEQQLVCLDEEPIGRLIVIREQDAIRLADIALLPAHRGAGIGGSLLGTLLAEAAQAHKPVRLQVLPDNPAIRLYQRLGFAVAGENGTHFLMEARPPHQAAVE